MARALHSNTYAKLRRLLAAARREAGLTQAQVADKLGRPQSFVSKFEGGERRLDVIEFLDICKVLGMSPVSVLQELGHR